MKNYYDLFVELSLQQCTKDDYIDKKKIEKHNIAAKKIVQLQNEMENSNHIEIFHRLLLFEDDRVRINAVSFCLKKNILVKESIIVLKDIVENSSDSTICFAAKMMLNQLGDG